MTKKSLVPFDEARKELGVSASTLKRLLKAGAPQARPGRRGRGGGALFDVEAIRAWQRQESAQDAVRVVATELPEVIAAACEQAFRLTEGPHKRPSADVLTGAWYLITAAVLDKLGEHAPVGWIESIPEPITRLQRIARGDHISPRRKLFRYKAFPNWPYVNRHKSDPLRGFYSSLNRDPEKTEPEDS